jgi:hypothetical protein
MAGMGLTENFDEIGTPISKVWDPHPEKNCGQNQNNYPRPPLIQNHTLTEKIGPAPETS